MQRENVSYVTLWRIIFHQEAVRINDYTNIFKLIELCFAFSAANAKSEQEFSFMRRTETGYRSRLSEISLSVITQIWIYGLPYKSYESNEVVNKLRRKDHQTTWDSNNTQHSGVTCASKNRGLIIFYRNKLFKLTCNLSHDFSKFVIYEYHSGVDA